MPPTAPGPVLIKGGALAVLPTAVFDAQTTGLRADALRDLRGTSGVMQQLRDRVRRIGQTDVSLLLQGESGTGKEMVARAVHEEGPRASRPFVTVDCAALSPTLFASELFGHERGAFTGADRRHVGLFEWANGGTVFLDEIADLPLELQSTLLGAVERRRVNRVGGRQEIPLDVRIIAATHRDLGAEVKAGRFRHDLFYRLAVVVLTTPPLREHREDIPALIEHFLRDTGSPAAVADVFPPAQLEELALHHWPGNVRELRNLVLGRLALGDQAPGMQEPSPTSPIAGDPIGAVLGRSYREARRAVLEHFERRYFERLLARNRGNISRAARAARMDRSYLTDLIRRHELDADRVDSPFRK